MGVTQSAVSHFMNNPITDNFSLAERILIMGEKIEKRQLIMTESHGAVFLIPESDQLCNSLLGRSLNETDEWSLFSRCRTCGNNRYLPIIMNEENYAACYHCLPPSQYPALGAVRQDGSLLLYALQERGYLADIESIRPQPKVVVVRQKYTKVTDKNFTNYKFKKKDTRTSFWEKRWS